MCRNQELRIKLSKEELQRLRKKADEMTLETSSFARMVLLNAKVEIKSEIFH